MILQISSMPSSYTPWVEGYVTYHHFNQTNSHHSQVLARVLILSQYHKLQYLISYHESWEILFVGFRSLLQLCNVDVSLWIGTNRYDLHSTHGCTCGVGPVCRKRNDAHVTVVVSSCLQNFKLDYYLPITFLALLRNARNKLNQVGLKGTFAEELWIQDTG